MQFEWDENKAKMNLKKHKVSFEEAKSVFYDKGALFIGDPDHSKDEDRFVLVGLSELMRELVVSHCEWYNEKGIESVRIISARKADKDERRVYWERKDI